MEAESGRGAVYNAVQFVGSADTGDRIDCHVEALATGRRTTQLRITATVADRVVLVAIGATGEDRTGLLSAQFGEMPDVPLPDDDGDVEAERALPDPGSMCPAGSTSASYVTSPARATSCGRG